MGQSHPFVIGHSRWEDSDFVVTIRPAEAKPWEDIPIGTVLNECEAKLVSDWLRSAIGDLMKIADNTRAGRPAGSRLPDSTS